MSQELPSPIQERFGAKLAELPAEEQASIRRALGNVARMMEEDSYGTSPKTRKR